MLSLFLRLQTYPQKKETIIYNEFFYIKQTQNTFIKEEAHDHIKTEEKLHFQSFP